MTPSIALMTYDPQGDWRGISRHFVQSRTPTQVASHAQKYFIRQNNMNKRKRRSSLFDIVSEAPAEAGKADGRVAGGAGGPAAAAPPGGLSAAFASHLGGYNPTGVAPPTTFSAHGATPPGVAAASAPKRGDTSAGTSDIGTAGEAAAATIAALSMAGSPAATAGYRAAAAAPGARGEAPLPGPSGAADLDAAAKAAQAQAQAAQVNGFAAMMAQMGAMGQMGQMGSFPPPANWMATYHQFLSQMTAAAAAARPAAGAAGGPANPFAAMPMGASPGVTFPPAIMGGMHMPGAVPAFPASAPGGLFRPTAARAAPGVPASAAPESAEEKAAMVTA